MQLKYDIDMPNAVQTFPAEKEVVGSRMGWTWNHCAPRAEQLASSLHVFIASMYMDRWLKCWIIHQPASSGWDHV